MRFSKGERLCLTVIVTTFLVIVLKSLVFSDVRSPWLPARLVKDSDVRSPWLSVRLDKDSDVRSPWLPARPENESDVRSPRLPNRRVFSGRDNRIKVKDAGPVTQHVILAAHRPWFVHSTQVDFSTCEFSGCTLTYNLSDLARASAVVFDALSLSHTLPPAPPRRPQQLWALFFLEPPPVLEAQDPTFQSSQWRGVFNLSMSYRYDSDIFSPYGLVMPKASMVGRRRDVYRSGVLSNRNDLREAHRTTPQHTSAERTQSKGPAPSPNFLQIAAGKTRTAVWLVSHCHAHSARDQYVRRLQRHLRVDVYGRCSGRRCGNDAECRSLINSTYRFVLSFENSFCRDYVTEKVFALYNNLHVLPVVRGGADYSRILPSGSYVDAGDFPSPEALARHLLDLERDHVTYAQMLERKSWYQAESWQWVWPFPWCQLCRMLHEDKTSSGVVRTYPDIAAWISHHTCWPAPDLP